MIPQQIRLIDETGKQLGVFSFAEARNIAQDKGLDLVVVTRKATPPVYKLGDYSKEKYKEAKKRKKLRLKEKHSLPKLIRIGFSEGEHDLNTKYKRLIKFLKEERTVSIEMKLRGREKAHFDLARQKITTFIKGINIPVKIIQPLKKTPRGFIVTMKQENQPN